MDERIIYVEKIAHTDPRLKSHIRHDSKSKTYAFDTSNVEIVDVNHIRHVPILDQGQVGRCTGNAGIGALYTDPFIPEQYPVFQPTEDGATALYSAAEEIDGDGPYPPNDHGSSGLSIATALKNVGMISGYQHTFTMQDALKALSQYPIMIGLNWYEDMFTPDADGLVHPTGALAGRHEFVCRINSTENGRITCDNSWGIEWGVNGTFSLTWEDFANLLAQGGDVIVLFPPHITPPTPTTYVSKNN